MGSCASGKKENGIALAKLSNKRNTHPQPSTRVRSPHPITDL